MAALVAAIHALLRGGKDVDGRNKSGHDGRETLPALSELNTRATRRAMTTPADDQVQSLLLLDPMPGWIGRGGDCSRRFLGLGSLLGVDTVLGVGSFLGFGC
jgi:hypothetical protein